MITAWIGFILFFLIMLLYVAIALGAPLGEFVMGGKHKVMPPKTRVAIIFSVLIQAFAIIILLYLGGILQIGISTPLAKGIGFFFAAYLLLNTFLNLRSESKKEKYVMTPLSIIIFICFLVTSIIS